MRSSQLDLHRLTKISMFQHEFIKLQHLITMSMFFSYNTFFFVEQMKSSRMKIYVNILLNPALVHEFTSAHIDVFSTTKFFKSNYLALLTLPSWTDVRATIHSNQTAVQQSAMNELVEESLSHFHYCSSVSYN